MNHLKLKKNFLIIKYELKQPSINTCAIFPWGREGREAVDNNLGGVVLPQQSDEVDELARLLSMMCGVRMKQDL